MKSKQDTEMHMYYHILPASSYTVDESYLAKSIQLLAGIIKTLSEIKEFPEGVQKSVLVGGHHNLVEITLKNADTISPKYVAKVFVNNCGYPNYVINDDDVDVLENIAADRIEKIVTAYKPLPRTEIEARTIQKI